MLKWLKTLFTTEIPNNRGQLDANDAEGTTAFHEGNIKFLSGDDESALPLYDKAIAHGIVKAYSQRAYCLQSLGYFLDAIDDFEQATVYELDDCNLYFSQSMAFMTVGRYSEAVSSMEKAVELSKIKNALNAAHDISAKNQGFNSITDMMLLKQEGINVIANFVYHKPVDTQKLIRRH